ncbi:MAG: hypothetical protein Q9191_006802 [Dirinaria sp. TL-2023a]
MRVAALLEHASWDKLHVCYVIADYERRNFSVSQCTWDANAQQHILPIKSLAAGGHSSHSHKLSGGAIAGVVIGSIIGLSALALLGFFSYKRFRKHGDDSQDDGQAELDAGEKLPPELKGDKYVGPEIDGKRLFAPEADGKSLPAYELGGTKAGHELDSGANVGHELDSGQTGAAEMPAGRTPVAELP